MSKPGLTKRQRLDCWEASDKCCHICGEPIDPLKEKWDAEHIIPRALRGSDKWPNLRPAHKRCHAKKTPIDRKNIAKAENVAERHLGITRPKGTVAQRPKQERPKRDQLPFPERKRDIYGRPL